VVATGLLGHYRLPTAKSSHAHDIIASDNQEERRTMAKRKTKSKPAARSKAARSVSRKRAARTSRSKRTSSSDRSKILAEMKSAGLTVKQAAKKYGISAWTIYGWRKTRAGRPTAAAKRGRPVGSRTSRGSLAEMLRPVIAELVREELTRLAAR